LMSLRKIIMSYHIADDMLIQINGLAMVMTNHSKQLSCGEGLVAHGMQGFDYEKARNHLEIPDNFDVMVMITTGKKGPKNNLPPQLQERE
jgi:hypothetical protein